MTNKEARALRVSNALGDRPIAWLASQLGVATSTAYSYIKGSIPPADKALLISDVLEIDYRWYLNGYETSTVNYEVVKVPLIDSECKIVGEVTYAAELLRSLVSDVSAARCLLQNGVTMRPSIPENSELIIIPLVGAPQDGKVYALFLGGRILVRRVLITMDQKWKAVCDNPVFRNEEKDTIPDHAFVGEVVWVAHRP